MSLRVRRPLQSMTNRWREIPVEPAGSTLLGVTVRPRQADAFGLDIAATLGKILALPITIVRLGAYWDRIEPRPGAFHPDELDAQVEAAEQAGKRIVICLGAVKTFGYPEMFVPAHQLASPLPEGTLISPASHGSLLEAAVDFVSRLVERYRQHRAIIAWQVEHEAVDPLGLEHSWRLSASFVQAEVEAVRRADPGRPILLNGYLPMSLLEGLPQWIRTRDQGDSLAVARSLADLVGLDAYPCHALASIGGVTVYLDRGHTPWPSRRLSPLASWARAQGHRVMVTEGQAEPWETITKPPSPSQAVPYSCGPERLIETYNQAMRWAHHAGVPLFAYLLWGAEYWILREGSGDMAYLGAVKRILSESGGNR